jgi:hypothetical protein
MNTALPKLGINFAYGRIILPVSHGDSLPDFESVIDIHDSSTFGFSGVRAIVAD